MSFGNGQSYCFDKLALVCKSFVKIDIEVYNRYYPMKKKVAPILASLLLACAIFSVSIYKGVTPNYAFSPQVLTPSPSPHDVEVDYELTYPGNISPDSPLWFAKALRDKIEHTLTTNPDNQAKLSLECADKRLVMARELFEKGKHDLGLATLIKAEKYLDMAVSHAKAHSVTDTDFFEKAALSSLKHREIIEEHILPVAPDDLRPEVVKTGDYAKNTYKDSRDMLQNIGMAAPDNPFDIE